MIRVISIVWFKIFPARFGGQKGIALFNKYLSDHFELICLCSDDNEAGKERYRVLPVFTPGKKQFLFPSSYFRIITTIQRLNPSYIILEHPYYGIIGIITKLLLNKKLIIHTHNIEYHRFQLQGNRWWRLLYLLEKATFRNADLLFFKTNDDLQLARDKFKVTDQKCRLIPYGVERPSFDKKKARSVLNLKYGIDSDKKMLLFASTLDYKPNAEAVELIYSQIVSLLDPNKYIILICGRNRKKEFQYLRHLKANGVIYCGEVEDINDYFGGADVFIDPVSQGGGIQSKILEALSYDLNVVCFSNMLNGIDKNVCGNKLYISNPFDYEQFGANIKQALNHIENTPEAFYNKYEWKKIAAVAAEAIRELN